MGQLRFSSLRVRLLLLVFLAGIPALALIFYASSKMRELAASDAHHDSLHVARILATEQERVIESAHQLLISLANFPQIFQYDSAGCGKVFANIATKSKSFTTLAAAKPNGDVFCSSTASDAPISFSDRPYFQEILKTRNFTISEFVVGRFSHKPIVTLSHPSFDDNGALRAVLVIGLDLSWVQKIVFDASLPPGSTVTVIDRNGTILARVPDSDKWTGKSAPESALIKTVLARREGTTDATESDEIPRLYAFTALRGFPDRGKVYVWVGIPKAVVFAEADRLFAFNIFALGFVVVLTLALAWTGSNAFVLRQVNVLIEATKKISRGEFGARTGAAYDQGEFGELARSFDGMAESLEIRYQQVKTLHEIDVAISSTFDLRAVLDVLLEEIDHFLPYSVTTAWLLNRETGKLESFACRNVDEKEWKEATLKSGGGISRMLPDGNSPVVVRNAQTDPRALSSEFIRKNGLVSFLRVPLIAKNEILGVLTFFTKEKHEFTTEEVEFLTVLAGQAAIAIHNARLYEAIDLSKRELERTTQYLDRSLKQLEGFYTALAPIAAAESSEAMMAGIIDRLLDATGADTALIRLWDKEENRYPIVSQRNLPEDYLKRVDAASSGSVVAWVITNGEPIIVPDIASDSRFKGKVQLQLGLRSCAMLPLKVHNEVRGVMHVASRQLGYFDQGQKDHLSALARQMGIALENRELYYDLKSSKDELERANKTKDEFLSVISHELRTPLNVIKGYTEIMRNKILGAINPEQEMALGKVMRQSGELLGMINGVLQVTRIEANAVHAVCREVNLDSFFDDLRSNYDSPMEKELVLNWDYPCDLPNITTDNEKLKHILQNLINNAIKFTEKGSVTISVRHDTAAGALEFRIADTGMGIPRDKLPIIFDRFRQVDSSETRSYGGLGIGLYIVRKFTELLGGTIEVDSEPGKGSTFSIVLPQIARPDLSPLGHADHTV